MTKDSHLPEGRELQFVEPDHPFMVQARKEAREMSFDQKHPTGAVIVQDGEIIGRGANGSLFHQKYGCIRKKLGIKSGTHYWMCPGCWTRNHAEQKAIADAKVLGNDTQGADVYLWGHSYCCKWCWAAMIKAGIKNVYLEKQKD